MRAFLRFLSQQRWPATARFGVTVATMILITMIRLVAPLDSAPFLLYLPAVLLISLAFGWAPGFVGVILADLLAAYFFVTDGVSPGLSLAQDIALAQFIVVGAAMVVVCNALRHAIIENELTLNDLIQSRTWLQGAKDEADAAKIQAETAQAAAETANLAKSDFIANMSHELRTPLSAIIGYAEMMLEELEEEGDTAGLATDMRKIEGNARHLLGLINDVLDLSKVESGKMEVYAEEFAVAAVMEEVATTVGSLVGKKGNRLVLELAPDLGSITSDLTKVRQILLNLLSNAAKFTEGGTVTIAAARERDGIVFRVADTGIGMNGEQLGRLFQRFQQADSSTTRRYGGTGLGLSLIKAFVDMLGGTVGVASTPGSGTTFTVTLPLSHTPDAAVVAEDTPDVIEDDHAGADLVLVIDDDENQRILMTRFLHREGFRVRTAADGETGLQLARQLTPRAILCDVMMPGIDGWSVLSALKADPELSAIPVVMVTFMEQRALAASLGAADYVMKPVQWDRFKSVMDRYRPPENEALVIDDDPDARARMRHMLERDGWSVIEAENGQEGLERLAARRPGIVLLDVTMPVMDGFAFLQAMRAQPACADIPVVVLTALDLTREDRQRLRGASQVLNKGEISLRALGDRLHQLAATPAAQAADAEADVAAPSPVD